MKTQSGTEHVQETAGTENAQTVCQLFSDVFKEHGRWQRREESGGGGIRRKDKLREVCLRNDTDVSPQLSGEPWLSHLLSFQDG